MSKYTAYLTKKNILLALLGLVTVTLTILSYMPKGSSSPQMDTLNNSEEVITDEFSFLPGPTPTPINNIQLQQLESDGVSVENLYKNNPEPAFRSNTTIAENNDYSIAFFVDKTLFRLTLYKEPFDQTQTQAEATFLSELKITQEQACKLNVEVVKQPTGFNVSPTTETKLSFCL